jgi:hypothetical protein
VPELRLEIAPRSPSLPRALGLPSASLPSMLWAT